MWEWGRGGLFVMSFKFRGWLTINNRLKWLSLFLTRGKILSLFALWKWGHDGVLLVMNVGRGGMLGRPRFVIL